MSSTTNWFNGLPSGVEGDGALGHWFNGVPAQALSSSQGLAPSIVTDSDAFYTTSLIGQSPLVPDLYSDTDSFYTPTVTPGAVTLTPGLYSDSDTYYSLIINPADYPLTPGLVTDADTFYAPVVKFDQFLTAGIYTDSDTTYSPSVSIYTQLTPDVYSDADSFFAPTVAPGAVSLLPDVYSDTDSFFAPTVENIGSLAPSLYSDADSFFAPTVVPGAVALSPGLVTDTDTIYAPGETAGYTLAPSLITDTDNFFAPTVSARGAMLPGLVDESAVVYPAVVAATYSLAPGLVTDADSAPRPVVRNGNTLLPSLYADAETFRAPTITTGPVTLRPNRFDATEVFYTPAVQLQSTQGGGGGGNGSIPANVKYATQFTVTTSGLISALQIQSSTAYPAAHTRMMLYADSSGLPGALLAQSAAKTGLIIGTNNYPLTVPYAVLVGTKVWVAFHTDTKVNVLGNSASGARYNTDTFSDGPADPFGASSLDNKKAPVLLVLLSAATATISPPLYLDSETFYAPAVTTRNTLLPPFVADTDFYYSPRVAGQVPLAPSMYADNEAFYVPTVAPGSVTLVPALFADTDSVVSPDVAAFSPTIFPPLVVDNDTLTIGDGINVTPTGSHFLPTMYADADAFYVPVVLGVKTLSPGIVTDADTIRTHVVSRGAVTLRPALYVANDQFWLETLAANDRHVVVSPLLAADDVFYSPRRSTSGFTHRTVTIKGSTRQHTKTLSTKLDNGATIVGDDSKVKIELEGNDA